MHVLALTTHVETFTSPAYGQDGQRAVVERSFDSVDVFVQADANMAANDSYNTIRNVSRVVAKELQNFNVKTIYGRILPNVFRVYLRGSSRKGITEDYLATPQCARSQVQ
jgi:hypothetical protein